MSRTKQQRIDEFPLLANAFQAPTELKGAWNKKVFKNDNPVVLELACGWGYYTNALAQKHPKKNFIGIDKKGDRLWHGAKKATELNLSNVAFCRILIERLSYFFDQNEVSEIWITFPDPQPKPSKANKRLTSPRFLDEYNKIIQKDALIHVKTDHEKLFEYSLEILNQRQHQVLEIEKDIHSLDKVPEALQITTFYEEKFMSKGIPIKYLKFKATSNTMDRTMRP